MVKYWGVRVGHGGQYAAVARQHGFVAIKWDALGDLAWLATAAEPDAAWRKLLEQYQGTYGVAGMAASIGAGQVRRFVREIDDGDIVLVPHTSRKVVYVGRVKGGFVYVPDPADGCPYRQRRGVEWIRDVPRTAIPQKLLNSLGSLSTVWSLNRSADEARSLVEGETKPGPTAGPKSKTRDVVAHLLDQLHALHPEKFEHFVAEYFGAIGYDARPTPYVGDGGIDMEGTLDAEGLAQVSLRVQVKRTQDNVGIDTVLKTRGALGIDEQGAVITLGGYTSQAKQEAGAPGKKTITLVEGERFAEMLLSHWHDLSAEAQALLGIRPKDNLPLRERFAVVEDEE